MHDSYRFKNEPIIAPPRESFQWKECGNAKHLLSLYPSFEEHLSNYLLPLNDSFPPYFNSNSSEKRNNNGTLAHVANMAQISLFITHTSLSVKTLHTESERGALNVLFTARRVQIDLKALWMCVRERESFVAI